LTITQIEVSTFPARFRAPFVHASAARTFAENVIVRVFSEDGIEGYGEGCPREYVTGETSHSARTFLNEYARDAARSSTSVAELRHWVRTHRSEIEKNPSAFCALELALLDHMAKSRSISIERLLELPELDAAAHVYTAVVGSGNVIKARMIILRYLFSGLRDFKIKLSGNATNDRKRLLLLSLFKSIRIRFDANNHWHDPQECLKYLSTLSVLPFAIEEPLQVGDIDGLREIALQSGLAIILDESFLSSDMLESLPTDVNWIANVRVSKLGGLLRALEAVETLRDKNIGIIVGAHVGETGLLTRAALPVARAAGDSLIAQEGAFGTHLLAADLTTPSPRFQRRGLISSNDLPTMQSPGSGLVVDRTALSDRMVLS